MEDVKPGTIAAPTPFTGTDRSMTEGEVAGGDIVTTEVGSKDN